MPTAVALRPVDPTALTDAERDALTEALYAVQRQVFAGVDRAAFRKYVIDSEARRTRIQVYRDDAGVCIGYAAIHLFSVDLSGKNTTVMRAEMGMLPAYRGQSLAWKFLAWEVARVAASPLSQGFFVACPVHPASYYTLARSTPQLFPRPEDTPEAMTALFSQLDDALGMSRPAGAGEHVRSVGWITRQSRAERVSWRNHDSALVQFFLKENPGYEHGEGLRIACPLSLRTLAAGLWSMAGRLVRRQRRILAGRRTVAGER